MSLVVVVLVAIGGVAAYFYLAANASSSSNAPGTVWNKTMNFTPGVTIYSPDDDGIGPVAISQNDSMIVMGTGQAIGNGSIYAFNQSGASLWTYRLNYFVSSISMSASGSVTAVCGYQIAAGPAGLYENPVLYLFNGQGAVMWNKSFAGQFVGAKLSSDGSRLVVVTETYLLYMNASGQVLWRLNLGDGATLNGWAMSPDGSRLIVSEYRSPVDNTSQSVSRSLILFNSGGDVLWNRTSTGTLSEPPAGPGNLIPSANWTDFFSSDASSGTNGSLLLFNENATLVWSRPIYSPVLDLQTGNQSQDVVVQTNWSTLVFSLGGQLLANYTGDPVPAGSHPNYSCAPASFWAGNLGYTDALFLNNDGTPVSSYSIGTVVSHVTLSSDGHYAVVVSNQEHRSSFFFVNLLEASVNCG
ncbi:MAG: PQQ-binding-like beta-propeller repeat protein [Nitrososphaerales archaeon]